MKKNKHKVFKSTYEKVMDSTANVAGFKNLDAVHKWLNSKNVGKMNGDIIIQGGDIRFTGDRCDIYEDIIRAEMERYKGRSVGELEAKREIKKCLDSNTERNNIVSDFVRIGCLVSEYKWRNSGCSEITLDVPLRVKILNSKSVMEYDSISFDELGDGVFVINESIGRYCGCMVSKIRTIDDSYIKMWLMSEKSYVDNAVIYVKIGDKSLRDNVGSDCGVEIESYLKIIMYLSGDKGLEFKGIERVIDSGKERGNWVRYWIGNKDRGDKRKVIKWVEK